MPALHNFGKQVSKAADQGQKHDNPDPFLLGSPTQRMNNTNAVKYQDKIIVLIKS